MTVTIREWAIDKRRFVHENVDGETIMLDTVGGQLLLLRGTAPLLLDALSAQPDRVRLLGDIAGRYGAEAAEATGRFLDEITALGVLVPVDDAETDDAETDDADTPAEAVAECVTPARATDAFDAFAGWPASFAAPEFEHYDEISDIITMDPIHDVDPAFGWPKAPPVSHA
jgi:hypothetical protein